jgi:hypothetical protein
MSEPFRFPFRDRSDSLSALGDLAGETLSGTEREVTIEVGLRLAQDGCHAIGDAVDRLEELGPAGRRRIVDEARVAVGLPDIETEAAYDRWKRTNDALRWGRDSAGRSLQLCHAEGCRTYPTDSLGMPQPTDALRGWCGAHAHLAAPGDLNPPSDAYIIGPFGRAIPVGEERERLEAEEAIRLEAEAERTAEREAIDKATAAAKERYLASTPGENVMGVPMSRVRKV